MSIVSISFPFFPARLNYKMLKNGTTWNFKVQNFFLPKEGGKSEPKKTVDSEAFAWSIVFHSYRQKLT